jgi:hypothetical protein
VKTVRPQQWGVSLKNSKNKMKTNNAAAPVQVELSTFINASLPAIQAGFMKKYDGTLEYVISHPALPTILNPTFGYHYLVAGVDPDGDIITTRDTTGESLPNGNQSNEMEINAYLLAAKIKYELQKHDLYARYSCNEFLPIYEIKSIQGKAKVYIKIDGAMHRIPGLTLKNM